MGKILVIINLFILLLLSCRSNQTINYADMENWAYFDGNVKGRKADVFFAGPTAFFNNKNTCNWEYFGDYSNKKKIKNLIGMQKGIYDSETRFFAPYYRVASYEVFSLSAREQDKYLTEAYHDIEDAFRYYMSHINKGQPVILAGSGQGAYMCARLVRDHMNTKRLYNKFIACYAPGWSFNKYQYNQIPWYKFARSATDLGVIVSFNSEDPSVTNSILVPNGMVSHCINPLNWRTDSEPAGKEQNNGAVFVDFYGTCVNIYANFTGAYIDENRGVLKVTDVDGSKYPSKYYLFADGVYHLYDSSFFYSNLKANVSDRIRAYYESDFNQ